MTPARRRLLLAMLLALLVAAPAARAADPAALVLKVANQLPGGNLPNVRLNADAFSTCWGPEGSDGPLAPLPASPGRASLTRTYARLCPGAFPSSRYLYLIPQLQETAGGPWATPAGVPTDVPFPAFDYPVMRVRTDLPDYFPENVLSTWVPRGDGLGLVCWPATKSVTNEPGSDNPLTTIQWTFRGDDVCNQLGGGDGSRSVAATAPTTTAASATDADTGSTSADQAVIVDVLSTAGILCPWWAYPGDTARCSALDVGNPANWVVDNVTTDVADFAVTDGAGTREQTPVGSASISIPATSPAGVLQVNRTVGTSFASSTMTGFAWKLGEKLGFKTKVSAKVPFVGEHEFESSLEISAEQNWSESDTATTTNTDQRAVQISAGAAPGYTTRLEVTMGKLDATYGYQANLAFGQPATAQPVVTPLTQALNISPASRQPCLSYGIGGADVRGSMMQMGAQMTAQGLQPTEPTLPEEQRTFLRGLPGYSATGGACPGFPDLFASQAAYKGAGTGVLAAAGYDANGNPVQTMNACVYQAAYGTSSAPPTAKLAALGDAPCQAVPTDNGSLHAVAPGNLIDTSKDDGDKRTTGTSRSDRIIGGDGRDTIRGGGGTEDNLSGGKGDDRIDGGKGDDRVDGGPGDDRIDGGSGRDELHGGAGDDTITAGADSTAFGEAGNDRLRGGAGSVLSGGAGNDVLTSAGALGLIGGTGDDTYVVHRAAHRPNIAEQPGQGVDTLRTEIDATVPAHVERAVAIGDGPVALTGTRADETLIGNAAANRLEGGAGNDVIDAGAGDDTIVLNPYGVDQVTGGAGADRFVVQGTPSRFALPDGVTVPADVSAHVLRDFDPAQGDRIVLDPSAVGPEVSRLRDDFTAETGDQPQAAKPLLLLDPRTGLVRFDRDGSGPLAAQVLVRLPGTTQLTRAMFDIR
jgi:Ca2+-binding RTX toxin-like protein